VIPATESLLANIDFIVGAVNDQSGSPDGLDLTRTLMLKIADIAPHGFPISLGREKFSTLSASRKRRCVYSEISQEPVTEIARGLCH
jgi:hypothetical protein